MTPLGAAQTELLRALVRQGLESSHVLRRR
jgi:hypothetical protein